MLKRQNLKKEKKVKVTFALSMDAAGMDAAGIDAEQVSVVGCFNQWDPAATPLKKRSNGTMSAAIKLEPGQKYAFRYYCSDGSWLNDEAADAYEPSGHGSDNCIVLT